MPLPTVYSFVHQTLSEIGSRTVINIFVIANPSPLPVFHPHHARFETINIRRRFHSILIPYIHSPIILGKRTKFLSGIGNQNLFGVLFARIPDSSFPCNQFKRVFVYDDLTGCLPCSFRASFSIHDNRGAGLSIPKGFTK